jgi:hypothetical protein
MPVPSISESHSQGLNLPDLTDSVELQRGGFWRRTFALFIDLAAIIAVLQMTAVVLFPLTNGHVQFSGGPLYALNCEYLESVPEGLSISAEFAANSITDCQQSLLGRPTSRTLSVSRITRDGAVTKVAQIRHMLDAEGKPARGLPLDILILPLLIALRFALDRIGASLFVGSLFGGSLFGGSLGRRICRIRLWSRSDGQYPPSASSVNRRYAALALPLAPTWIWSAYGALFPGPELVGTAWYWLCWVGTGVPLLIAALEAADSIIRRRDAFYDRFAQTSVLRLDPKNAVIAIAVAAPPTSPRQSDLSAPHIMPEASCAPPPLLPRQASRSRNYVARHWRGELSLPVSYWRHGRRHDRRAGVRHQPTGRRAADIVAVLLDRHVGIGRAADDLAGGRGVALGHRLPAKRQAILGRRRKDTDPARRRAACGKLCDGRHRAIGRHL